MKINKYNITTYAFVDTFDLMTPQAYDVYDPLYDNSYGVSVDTDKAYAINNTASNMVRMDKTSVLGDLLAGSLGAGDANFNGPTYSVIVGSAEPVVPVTKSFGNIIW